MFYFQNKHYIYSQAQICGLWQYSDYDPPGTIIIKNHSDISSVSDNIRAPLKVITSLRAARNKLQVKWYFQQECGIA